MKKIITVYENNFKGEFALAEILGLEKMGDTIIFQIKAMRKGTIVIIKENKVFRLDYLGEQGDDDVFALYW